MTESCPKGQYYCYTDKKCKKIPKGYMIGARGYLRQEPQEDDSKKNGNGNGNGHSKSNGSGRNGSGNGNGNSGGNGGSGGVSEATMTSSQKRKDTMLKKKYDDSDMKKNMKKQYGKEEGEKVYYATIRKQAMESNLGKLDEVGYYSGQDRDSSTGLPKGLKSIPGGKKDKPLKGVPYNILRAHTEIPVVDIKVSTMDELTDYRTFAAKAQEARDKKKKRREDQKEKDKQWAANKKERIKKGIKFYDTKGKGYVKDGVKTYDEERTFPDGFLKKYPNLNPTNSRDYRKLKQLLNYPKKVAVNPEVQTEGSLHKWFKGSKSKDGKPGWVNVKTGGTCASDEPGEGTPKCVSSSKRASMSKAERESASRRKKAADPNQQSKSGAAKPTYVSTDKPKKKMKENFMKDKSYVQRYKKAGGYLNTPARKKADAEHAKNNPKRKPFEPIKRGTMVGNKLNDEVQYEAKDKKGKGSGKKDACYHKVKASASVWPSAYASGRLVQCRKKGAANYGKSKKEELISYKDMINELTMKKDKKVPLGRKSNPYGKRAIAKMIIKSIAEPARRKAGVSKEETQLEDSRLTSSNDMQSKMYADKNKSGKKMSDDEIKKEKGGKEFLARLKAAKEKMKKEGTSYGLYKGDGKPKGPMAKFGEKKKKEKKIEEKVNLKDKSSQYARSTKEVDTAMTDHVNRKRGTHYGKDGKVTEVGRYRRQSKREARNELISMNKESKSYSQFTQECWKTHKKVGMKMKNGKLVNDCRPKNEEVAVEGAAWTKKSGKNKEGGLNEKGRKSYERENPGSDLKAPTKKVGNPRRASFCARMKGMRKRQKPSNNTGDDRLSKSLRKWNC
tara:strand:+ start:898 stop:3417 length:2520 start_codon:yes stop_codon:yes gene_type:complete